MDKSFFFFAPTCGRSVRLPPPFRAGQTTLFESNIKLVCLVLTNHSRTAGKITMKDPKENDLLTIMSRFGRGSGRPPPRAGLLGGSRPLTKKQYIQKIILLCHQNKPILKISIKTSNNKFNLSIILMKKLPYRKTVVSSAFHGKELSKKLGKRLLPGREKETNRRFVG